MLDERELTLICNKPLIPGFVASMKPLEMTTWGLWREGTITYERISHLSIKRKTNGPL